MTKITNRSINPNPIFNFYNPQKYLWMVYERMSFKTIFNKKGELFFIQYDMYDEYKT